ncbi:N-ethylammeline chlorohydrolase [Clostridia bacterium]|nr:N-ethylammeline chlorohydrolase [Clostridia bacterium]
MNTRFYNAKILRTKPNQRFEIEEGELWVQGNRISYLGKSPERKVREETTWDREIDAKGNLLMPGFKNAHTHSGMTFLRSLADDLPLQEWLFQQIFPKEAQLVPEDLYWLTALANLEYLTSGITTQFDMYFFQEEVAKACVDMGFRLVQTSGLNNFGGSIAELEEKYLKFNEYHELSSYFLGFHAEYTTSKELMEGVASLVQKYKAPLYVHNSETKQEVEDCKKRYGLSPTQFLDRLGMYDYGGGGYHCVWFNDTDINIFAHKGLSAVTNPGSNAKLASGIAPIKKMLKAGVNIAIGTDGPASNNCLDMWKEMFLVSSLAKLKDMDAAVVDGEQVLYMATAGGAKAMGLGEADCLEIGKLADLILIDLNQPNMQPINHITKNLVYSGSKQNVKLTMVNGKILYEENRFFTNLDPAEIYRKANEIVKRMK